MKVYTLLCAVLISAYAAVTSDQNSDSSSGSEELDPFLQCHTSWPGCNRNEYPYCIWGCRECSRSGSCPDCRWNCNQCEWDCSGDIEIDPKPDEPTTATPKPDEPTTATPKPDEPTTTTPKPQKDFNLYASPDYQGDAIDAQLNKVGDCVEFWNPDKNLPQNLTSFDNRGRSIRLSAGLCVRLFEHDCDWKRSKGKVLDVLPDSPWASKFDSVGMDGVSAVKRIECPSSLPPQVTVYKEKNYSGKSVNLGGLRTVGDCQEFWNPNGYGTMISNELREFNDQTVSIKLRDASMCLRFYERDCKQTEGRFLDVTPVNSKVLTDLSTQSWNGIVSAIEVIPCPLISSIVVYSKPNFEGDSLTLTGVSKPGDCVEFWSPKGYNKPISDDVRHFNDRTMSVRLPAGTCVRLYDNNCGEGRSTDVLSSGSPASLDTSKGNLGGAVSSVVLTQCP